MRMKIAVALSFLLLAGTVRAQKTIMVDQIAVFNKEETLKMVTAGQSVIAGQLFAKDSPNKGVALMNINKRQYAPIGTQVVLMPYTAYFKEYVELSKKLRKQNRAVTLPDEAVQCLRVTRVQDATGGYAFSNLMPGEYLLMTNFGYVHTTSHTETVGQTNSYVNGNYIGSTPLTQRFWDGQGASAAIEKLVTIETNGETKKADLKKTR